MPATAVFAPGANALITGAASGVGLAIARLCQSKGMNILLVDRNAEALEAARKELSGGDSTIAASVTDVSSPADWAKLKNVAAEMLGTIELLVLNAGTGMRGTWGDEDYFRNVSSPIRRMPSHEYHINLSRRLRPICLA